MNKSIVRGALVIALFCGAVAMAQAPGNSVSAKRHPNLAAAQHFVDSAWAKISAAQAANEFDLAGHAAKAKDLLDQANRELKLSAEQSNANQK
jgi:hypothetical protein